MARRPHPAHATEFESVFAVLKNKGMRVTKPRRLLLRSLLDEHGPFTMEDLHKKIGAQVCDLVTIYRCLGAFEKLGLVKRCDFGDGSIRYEFNHGDCHHHVVCKVCRRVEVLEQCHMNSLQRSIEKLGYTDVSHMLEFFGICRACRKKNRVD